MFMQMGNGMADDDDDHCLVCRVEANELHFQVNVCRACAAFFRRSVKNKKVYTCRRGSRNCDLTKATNICRYCRLQKCFQVGMRYDVAEKVPDEKEHSSSSTSNGYMIPQPQQTYAIPPLSTLSSPNGILAPSSSFTSATYYSSMDSIKKSNSPESTDPNLSDSTYQNGIIGLENGISTVEKVKNILGQEHSSKFYTPPGVHLTPLQQLQYGVAIFLDNMKPSDPYRVPIAQVADNLEQFKFQEEYCLKAAELVMCCEPFVKLPFNDKWLLFRHFWCSFYAIERIYSTIELFGYELDDTRHLITPRLVVDDHTLWEISGIAPEKSIEFIEFCKPLREHLTKNIAHPMKMWQITRFEFVYLMAQMLWSVYEVKGISDHAKTIGYEVLEHISSELHNFYFFDMHLQNYASRHAKLIRLLKVAENQVHFYKDYMTMAKVFNIFEFDLYESELIE